MSKIGSKYLQVRCTNYFSALQSFKMFIGPLFSIKLHLQISTVLPLSKTVLGIFHGCGGRSKHNCLQDWASFYRSQAWQIVPIFDTVNQLWFSLSVTSINLFGAEDWNIPCQLGQRCVCWWAGSSRCQGPALLTLKSFYLKAFSRKHGCDWLMLKHQPITATLSAKSF